MRKLILFLLCLYGSTCPITPREREDLKERLEECSSMKDLYNLIPILQREKLDKEVPLSYPLEKSGRISSRFGIRKDPFNGTEKRHQGIDIAVPLGTPVFSTANGIVRYAGRKKGFGRCVLIQHSFGFSTLYAHLSAYYVTAGKAVRHGQLIGFVGKTGRATGYHLHYEIRKRMRPINPLP